jgi:outer membrane receptor protein involved in Fe transport
VAPESRGAVDQAADATWFNALGRGEIRREPWHLTLLAWGGRDDRGNGTLQQRNRMSGATVAATVTADVAPATIVSARVSHSPNTFDQTFSIVLSGRGSETVNSTQRTETSTSRAMVEVARGLPRSMLFLRGSIQRAAADFSDARATGTTVLALDDAGESVSAHFETVPVGRLTTSAGVRHEWRAAPTALDARDRATVGHLGASVRVTDTVAIRGAVATSHRWPTLNELVRDFQVGAVRTLSNSDLDPERARTAEVGVGYTRGRSASLSATVFRTVVDDAIANVTIPSTSGIVRQRRNAGETRATGLELDGQWARGRTTLRGSVTLTDASFATSDEPAIDGNRLPQIPRASASVWADVAISSRLRSTVFWQGASTQFDDDRNTFELGSASQVGVRVGGPVGRIEWSLAFENLFDNRIEVGRTPLVTLAPGREIRFSVTWKQ